MLEDKWMSAREWMWIHDSINEICKNATDFKLGIPNLGATSCTPPQRDFFNWSRYKFNLSCNEWNELIVCVCVCVQRMQSRPCPAHTERDSFLVSENELWFLYVICLFMRPQTQVKLNGNLLNKVRGERAREEGRRVRRGDDHWHLENSWNGGIQTRRERARNAHKIKTTKAAKRNLPNETIGTKQRVENKTKR